MSQSISIHLHFDGKVLVPDEPVNLPVNQPLIADVRQPESSTMPAKSPADMTIEERRAALKKLIEMSANDPIVPLEALRRVNLYDDGRY